MKQMYSELNHLLKSVENSALFYIKGVLFRLKYSLHERCIKKLRIA